MPELNQHTRLYAPPLHVVQRDGWTMCVDAEAPNWAAVDARGAWLLRTVAETPCMFAETSCHRIRVPDRSPSASRYRDGERCVSGSRR